MLLHSYSFLSVDILYRSLSFLWQICEIRKDMQKCRQKNVVIILNFFLILFIEVISNLIKNKNNKK